MTGKASPQTDAGDALSDDAFLGGALSILQPKSGYRAGIDPVLLAASLHANEGAHVLDAGAGAGVAGLAIAHRVAQAKVTLVEQEPALVEIARTNIARNGMAERVQVVAADITRPLSASPELHAMAERFDHVLANPPFMVHGRGTAAGDPIKAAANAMPAGDLERWMRFAASMLRPGGTLALIHRADALADVLAALDGRFGDAAVLPVHPYADKPASRILVHAAKGSRAPLRLMPGLVLHNTDRSFSADVEAVLRHGAALDAFRDR
jgi:tRNA1(Val) A37 N6-methylase TrmN6